MSSPDRRVPHSKSPRADGDDFFVDITPPEFGENGVKPVAPSDGHTESVSPNFPGQPTFVERRTSPVKANASEGLFFRTPKAKPADNASGPVSGPDSESTDEVPVVSGPNPQSVETQPDPRLARATIGGPDTDRQNTNDINVDKTSNQHSSETITQDIPHPAVAAPDTTSQTETESDNKPGPPNQPSQTDNNQATQPVDQPETAGGEQPDPLDPANVGQQAPSDTTDNAELSPAQVQLAEMRAMLANFSRPSDNQASKPGEPPTNEHPITEALQAKLVDDEQPDETAVEVLPKGDSPPPPPRPRPDYFPTPEQKKAHARFLPPTHTSQSTSKSAESKPSDDRYGLRSEPSSAPWAEPVSLVSNQPSDRATAAPNGSDDFHDRSQEITDEFKAAVAENEPGNQPVDSLNGSDTGADSSLEITDQFQAINVANETDGFNKTNSSVAASSVATATPKSTNPANGSAPSKTTKADSRRRNQGGGFYAANLSNGEYDYDHEYYSANKPKPSFDPPQRSDGQQPSRVSNDSPRRQPNRTEETLAKKSTRRKIFGRLVLPLFLAGAAGGVWWANNTGVIELSELRDLVSTSASDDGSNESSLGDSGPTPSTDSDTANESSSDGIAEQPETDIQTVASDDGSDPADTVRIVVRTQTTSGEPMSRVPVRVISSDESAVVAEFQTSVDGLATYFSESPGCFQVEVQTLPGWVLTSPADGTFSALCGESPSSFDAEFQPSSVDAPSSCQVTTGSGSTSGVVVNSDNGEFADSYTLYDRFGQKLAAADASTDESDEGQRELTWSRDNDFEPSQVAAVSANATGEESLLTTCE